MPYRVYAYMCVCTEQQQKKKEHKESPPPSDSRGEITDWPTVCSGWVPLTFN